MAQNRYYKSKGSTTKGQRQYAEDNLQAECVKWYNNEFCTTFSKPRGLIFAVPNGGSRNIVEAIKMRDTGTLSGVSDLIVIMPNGRLLFVEMKIEKGEQSKEQIDFEIRVKQLGYEYVLIYSLEEFKTQIYARI